MNEDGADREAAAAIARRQAFSTVTLSEDASTSASRTLSLAGATLSASGQRSNTTPTTTLNSESVSHLATVPAALSTLTDLDNIPARYCTAALPSGGIIKFNDTFAIILEETVSFQAPCQNNTVFCANNTETGNSTVIPFGDPFYASIAPQTYALATATILSYLLVIILFITPRTFYVGGPGGSSAYSGGASGFLGRGLTFMSTGGSNSSIIGIGRRPLLQKIATVTVAVSLTIATEHTFTVAQKQYAQGFMDASALVYEVVGSLEIRIIRVISDAFLWLAQVQTLIRLFPRHKEKVTIKWLGFALVICDTVFSILENFVSRSNRTRPESFTDAIPALSYLFELSISLIYASCVIYYSLSKRRFAFWHPKMRNMCILALLGLSSVMVPVVFFIVDVAQPDIATWGEYIRWVGAAAASVVVWEWVERIEAVERDEKKDGILGREIFDGDEMLEMTTSDGSNYGRGVHFGSSRKKGGNEGKHQIWKNIRDLDLKPQINIHRTKKTAHHDTGGEDDGKKKRTSIVVDGISQPPQVASPINRLESSSASTTYAVKYHNPLSPSPAIPEETVLTGHQLDTEANGENPSDESTLTNTTNGDLEGSKGTSRAGSQKGIESNRQIWQAALNPFKRKRAEPPAEVAAQITDSNMRRSPAERSTDIRRRFNAFTSAQKQRFAGRARTRTPLQVTVIPAQSRLPQSKQTVESAANPASVTTTAAAAEEPSQNRSSSRDASIREGKMPITVIPPPIRGGRTWSPDDLDGSHNKRPTPGQSDPRVSAESDPEAPTQETSNRQAPGQSLSSRSTNHESQSVAATHINRVGSAVSSNHRQFTSGRSASSSPSHLHFRSAGRDRGETMASISDRLSTSPVATISSPSSPAAVQPRQFNAISRQGSTPISQTNVPAAAADSATDVPDGEAVSGNSTSVHNASNAPTLNDINPSTSTAPSHITGDARNAINPLSDDNG